MEIVGTANDQGTTTPYPAMVLPLDGSLDFAKPNKLALSIKPLFDIFCDGRRLWSYRRLRRQYTECPVDETNSVGELLERSQFFGKGFPHPALHVRANPRKTFDDLFPTVRELRDAVSEARDGEAGWRVCGTFDAGRLFQSETLLSWDAWLSESKSLLREIRLDVTEPYNKLPLNAARRGRRGRPRCGDDPGA
jgi:hypothetical protein